VQPSLLSVADEVSKCGAGLGGGGLQAFQPGRAAGRLPAGEAGVAMTLFGLAALLAPVVGPTLGGWITDSYSWRWVFYIKRPGRPSGICCVLCPTPGSGLSHEAAYGVEEAAVPF